MKQNMMIHIVFLAFSLFQAAICSDCSSNQWKKLDELKAKVIESRARANNLWNRVNLSENVTQEKDQIQAWYTEMEAVLAEALLKSEEKRLGLSKLNQDR